MLKVNVSVRWEGRKLSFWSGCGGNSFLYQLHLATPFCQSVEKGSPFSLDACLCCRDLKPPRHLLTPRSGPGPVPVALDLVHCPLSACRAPFTGDLSQSRSQQALCGFLPLQGWGHGGGTILWGCVGTNFRDDLEATLSGDRVSLPGCEGQIPGGLRPTALGWARTSGKQSSQRH